MITVSKFISTQFEFFSFTFSIEIRSISFYYFAIYVGFISGDIQ